MTVPFTTTRRRRTLWLFALAALLLAAAAALVVLRPAQATTQRRAVVVTCGQTITTNIVVSNDLSCPGIGLVIGANGITLNLDGHTIGGPGVIGVRNDGFDNVKIQDGTVTRFATGVEIMGGATGNKVIGIRAHANGTGILVNASSNATINGSSATGSSIHGINVISSPQSEITNSTANGNSGLGVAVGDSDDVVVSGTKAVSNGAHGVLIDSQSDGAEIKNTVASSNDQNGIQIDNPTAKLTGNGNTALYNTELGIDAVPGVTDAGGSKAHDNGDPHQCENVACS